MGNMAHEKVDLKALVSILIGKIIAESIQPV